MKRELITAVVVLSFCAIVQSAEPTAAPKLKPLAAEKIEQIMAHAYTNLDADAWKTYSETHFDKDRDVAAVKALLENDTDARWASILLDRRIVAPGMSHSKTVGIIWLLSGAAYPPFPSYGLDKAFELFPKEEQAQRELLGTTATLRTVRDTYGEPKTVKKTDDYEVHYYGFIGFRTDTGKDRITGLVMPFVLFKLGHKEFAQIVLDARPPATTKTDANKAPEATR